MNTRNYNPVITGEEQENVIISIKGKRESIALIHITNGTIRNITLWDKDTQSERNVSLEVVAEPTGEICPECSGENCKIKSKLTLEEQSSVSQINHYWDRHVDEGDIICLDCGNGFPPDTGDEHCRNCGELNRNHITPCNDR